MKKEYVYVKQINNVIKPSGIYNTLDSAITDLEMDIAFYENMCKDLNFKFELVNKLPKSFVENHEEYMKEYEFLHNSISEHIVFHIFPAEKKEKDDTVSDDSNENESNKNDGFPAWIVKRQTRKGGTDHQSSTLEIIGQYMASITVARIYIEEDMNKLEKENLEKGYKKSKYESDGNQFLLAFYKDPADYIYYDYMIEETTLNYKK